MADPFGAVLRLISPHRALKRAEALYRLGLVNEALSKRDYDAAGPGARWGKWRGTNASANAEIARAHERLKNRGRDLIRNDPYARRAKNVLVGEIFGTGIVASSATGDAATDERVDALWSAWCEQADADGLLNLDGMIALGFGAMIEGGDTFFRRRLRRMNDGLAVPLQLQVMEGDYLDTSVDGTNGGGGYEYRSGIGFDAIGQRQVYRMFRTHPGDPWMPSAGRFDSVDVRASEIIHLFHQERPGQLRGVTWFAPVIGLLRDLGDFREAALVKKKTESLFGVAITSAEAGDGMPALSAETNASSRGPGEPLVEELYPGMSMRLKPGETLTSFAPSAVASDLDAFIMHGLMASGAGLMVTYDQISGDLRGANFSSMKVGKSTQRRFVESIQWLLLIPRVYRRVWGWFIEAAIAAGQIPPRDGGYPAEFTPPAHEAVQPKSDQEADYFAMLTGRVTPKEYVEAFGRPYRRQLRDWVESLKAWEAAGMPPLQTMPGAAPAPNQPAAPDT